MSFEFDEQYRLLKESIETNFMGVEELKGVRDATGADKMPGLDDEGGAGDKVREKIEDANIKSSVTTFLIQQFIYATVKQMITEGYLREVNWDDSPFT
jgi:hypothetical protein